MKSIRLTPIAISALLSVILIATPLGLLGLDQEAHRSLLNTGLAVGAGISLFSFSALLTALKLASLEARIDRQTSFHWHRWLWTAIRLEQRWYPLVPAWFRCYRTHDYQKQDYLPDCPPSTRDYAFLDELSDSLSLCIITGLLFMLHDQSPLRFALGLTIASAVGLIVIFGRYFQAQQPPFSLRFSCFLLAISSLSQLSLGCFAWLLFRDRPESPNDLLLIFYFSSLALHLRLLPWPGLSRLSAFLVASFFLAFDPIDFMISGFLFVLIEHGFITTAGLLLDSHVSTPKESFWRKQRSAAALNTSELHTESKKSLDFVKNHSGTKT